jgi:hypothetical protein
MKGKGSRVHEAVVSQDVLQRLAEAALARGWDGKIDGTYTPKRWGLPGMPALVNEHGRRLSKQWVTRPFVTLDNIIRDVRHPRITCHWPRHTTITQVERWSDEVMAAKWANHAPNKRHGDDTERYSKITLQERRDLFNDTFPTTPTGGWDPVNKMPAALDPE